MVPSSDTLLANSLQFNWLMNHHGVSSSQLSMAQLVLFGAASNT
jgi:hypothetical protein